jgi:hypothetical protein
MLLVSLLFQMCIFTFRRHNDETSGFSIVNALKQLHAGQYWRMPRRRCRRTARPPCYPVKFKDPKFRKGTECSQQPAVEKTAERDSGPYMAKERNCCVPESIKIGEECLNGGNVANNGDFGENQAKL